MTYDGLPAEALAARWGVPLCRLETAVSSALDTLHALAAGGAPAGTLVLAETQVSGRGRGGRGWQSPMGGVWLALLARPEQLDPGPTAVRVGLAVAAAVDELLGRSLARCKWPNDVLLDGRKVAGVLCEARWQGEKPLWMGLGVGVNVANPIPADLQASALSLAEVCAGVRRLDLLDRLVPRLSRLDLAAPVLNAAEQRHWAARDWLRGRTLVSPEPGRAAGIRADGALLVDTGDALVAVHEGHVTLS